jgi:hypothetical protein
MLSFEYRFKNSSFHGAAEAESGLKSVRESCFIKLLNTCVKHLQPFKGKSDSFISKYRNTESALITCILIVKQKQAVEMDSDLEAEEFFKTLSVTATEVV